MKPVVLFFFWLMDGELIWKQVAAYRVASWSLPVKPSRKRPHVEGYEDVPKSDFPPEIFQVIGTHGWTNFAQISSEPDIFITGSNMATRLRVAKALNKTSGGHTTHNRGSQGSQGSQGSTRHGNQDSHGTASNLRAAGKYGPIKALFDSGTLYVEAAGYGKKVADPEAILEQIFKVVDAAECKGFLAVVRLHDFWWSPGTHETRHQSSERPASARRSFQHGLPRTDWWLGFVQERFGWLVLEPCLQIVEKSDGILDSVNMDENRITTDGATKLVDGIQARALSFGHQPLQLQLMNNPVDNCEEVEAVADAAGLRCRIGPPWTMEEAARAVKSKKSWWVVLLWTHSTLEIKDVGHSKPTDYGGMSDL